MPTIALVGTSSVEDSTDPDGSPRARIRYGAAGERLLRGMRAAARAMLNSGNQVILDEMPLDDSNLPAWRQELAGYQTYWSAFTRHSMLSKRVRLPQPEVSTSTRSRSLPHRRRWAVRPASRCHDRIASQVAGEIIAAHRH